MFLVIYKIVKEFSFASNAQKQNRMNLKKNLSFRRWRKLNFQISDSSKSKDFISFSPILYLAAAAMATALAAACSAFLFFFSLANCCSACARNLRSSTSFFSKPAMVCLSCCREVTKLCSLNFGPDET